jgi:hypothetical protein
MANSQQIAMATDMMTNDRAAWAACASLGQLAFAPEIAPETRETVREMWVNRINGFSDRDLGKYLRDNTDNTRYRVAGREVSGRKFRRASAALFAIRRLVGWIGIEVTAEALDARVEPEQGDYVTRCCLVLTILGRVFRQSSLTMSLSLRAGGGVWTRAVEEPIRRADWPYERRTDDRKAVRWTRRSANLGDTSRGP